MNGAFSKFIWSCAAVAALGAVAVARSPVAAQEANAPPSNALPADYSCTLCHRKEGELWNDATPVTDETQLANDIHWQKGIRCHDCHGGSATLEGFKNHRNDPDFRSLRGGREDSITFCGHCHSNIDYMRRFSPSARTDQESEYWTSGHGRRLKASVAGENPAADKAVATCISCHGGHGILAVHNASSPVYAHNVALTCAKCHSDPKVMAGRTFNGRPLGHDQFEQWKQSVHGRAMLEKKDLSAPTCNDCHGNHGALPPSVGSVANACGTCHGKIAKLFGETRMKHKFEDVGVPGCAACHGSHSTKPPSDAMIGMDSNAVCSRCHNAQNLQYGATMAGAELANRINDQFRELKREIDEVEGKLRDAERLGMEIRGSRYDLRQAFDAMTNARTLVHSFKPGPVEESLGEGLKVTTAVRAAAEAALQEHTNRRLWLAATLIPILLVVALLLLTIRLMPSLQSTTTEDAPEDAI